MSGSDIVFVLAPQENIVVRLNESLEQVDCCYRADTYLFRDGQSAVLSTDSIFYDMSRLYDFLNKALHKQLLLHESLTQDIGYLCNEYYQNKTGFVVEELVGGLDWVGYKHHLWEAYSDGIRLMTWVYNNKKGIIIFEVTSCYPYLHCNPEIEQDYVAYDEWIKTYRPYFIHEIPTAIALEWLKQAEMVIKQIGDNIKRWEKEALIKNDKFI